MQIFTKAQYEQLLKNGTGDLRGQDHFPVVKLFMGGVCTWLLTELDPEYPDIAFGLCDLGMGFPELGCVSITELIEAQSPRKLIFLERDLYFEGEYPISVYARAASQEGYIVTEEYNLKRAVKPQP